MPTSRVTVAKQSLAFSAAHFLTLPGHVCERLHGHNYRVAVTTEGPVDPGTGFVVDFAVVKQVVRAVIEPLDHRVLIPAAGPHLTIREAADQVVIDYTRKDWMVVPREHACQVPVAQTTAEMLGAWMARQVWDGLQRMGCRDLTRVVVELEESPGQSATVEMTSRDS